MSLQLHDYTQSDNAGCYHGNYSAESMYRLCEQKGICLLRYDFNEAQCGKDQCECDSAAAKSILLSYLDNGNDLIKLKTYTKDFITDLV